MCDDNTVTVEIDFDGCSNRATLAEKAEKHCQEQVAHADYFGDVEMRNSHNNEKSEW